jgi:hypothetical protein
MGKGVAFGRYSLHLSWTEVQQEGKDKERDQEHMQNAVVSPQNRT